MRGGAALLPNPNLSPGLVPYDLTRGGSLFQFHGNANINEQAGYAQDQITWKNWAFNVGLRFDHYDGITQDNLFRAARRGFVPDQDDEYGAERFIYPQLGNAI